MSLEHAPVRFVRLKAVMGLTGLSASSIYDLMALKEFPASVPLSTNRRGWVLAEIESWQKERLEKRDTGAAVRSTRGRPRKVA